MSVDTSNAFMVGGASALIGFGLAYFAFKKFISDKYGQGKAQANKLFYWCGLFAMIAIGQGLGTIFNEIIFAFTNNSSINGDAIARGVVTFVFYPAMLAIIALLINKFRFSNGQSITIESFSSAQTSHKSQSKSINFSSTQIYAFLIILLVSCGVFFFLNGSFSLTKEKKFEAVSCEHCRWLATTQKFDCNPLLSLRYFVVGPEKIQIFGIKDDGSISVQELPDAETKCILNSNAKFSFACSSSTFSSQNIQMFESSKEFDGSGVYKSNFKAYFNVNGEFKLWNHSKTTCSMKG